MGVVELLQIGAVAVAVAALLLGRAHGRPAVRPPEPDLGRAVTPAGTTDSRVPKELIAAWVQFLRSEVADGSNALNNRLSAIKTRLQTLSRVHLTREEVSELENVDAEIKRANAITAGLLRRVTALAPDAIPESFPVRENASSRPADILVVEDDASNREVITRLLKRLGHRVTPARNGMEAFEAMQFGKFDCIIADLHMPWLGGCGLFEQVEEHMPNLASRFVFVTGDYTRPGAREFLQRTGCAVICKPYEIDSLLSAVAATLERSRLIAPT